MKFTLCVIVCFMVSGCFNHLSVRNGVINIDARRYWFSPEKVPISNTTKIIVSGIAWTRNEITIVSPVHSSYDVILGGCRIYVNSGGCRVVTHQRIPILYEGLIREIRIVDKLDKLKIIVNQYASPTVGETIYDGPSMFSMQNKHVYIIEPKGCEIEVVFPYTFY